MLSTTGGSALVVATNLAYPLADLLLLALVVAMFGLTGWRFDATWALVALGFAVFAIADSLYLYETAAGTYVEGGPLDVGWPAALVLIACSAWQPLRRLQGVRAESWQALTLPTIFAGSGPHAARLRPLRPHQHRWPSRSRRRRWRRSSSARC